MKKTRLFWGAIFIASAILILLDRAGITQEINIFKVLITIVLLYWLWKSIVHKSISEAIFPIAFLCMQYDDVLHIDFIGTWTILVVACLLSIGFAFLFPKKKYYHLHYKQKTTYNETHHSSHIEFSCSFADSIKYINSSEFEQAIIHCNFGNIKVYLDHAQIINNKAYMMIDGSFCGVELFVPKEWRVENHMEFILGGSEEYNVSSSNGYPILILQGKIAFGGLTITYI